LPIAFRVSQDARRSLQITAALDQVCP